MTIFVESKATGDSCVGSACSQSGPPAIDSAAADCQKARDHLLREISFIYDASFDQLESEAVERAATGEDVFAQVTTGTESRPDGLPAYIASLYLIPLLTAKGEASLFRKMNFLKYRANAFRTSLDPHRPSTELIDQIEDLLNEAERVRSQLVQSNLRLVVSIARRFASDRAAFDDLVSEGNLILIKAVEKFDYSRGFRFSTYLTHSVQRHFYRHFRNTQRRKNKQLPASDEVLRNVAAANSESSTSDVSNAHQQASQLLSRMEDCLDEREQFIVCERFGLNSSGKVRTLQSLSEDLGVCKERVRQLSHKAIDKLRHLALDMKREIASA